MMNKNQSKYSFIEEHIIKSLIEFAKYMYNNRWYIFSPKKIHTPYPPLDDKAQMKIDTKKDLDNVKIKR